MLIIFGLSDPDGGIKVVVGECAIEDGVTVVLQVSRLAVAWSRLPAVEEEDVHGMAVSPGIAAAESLGG